MSMLTKVFVVLTAVLSVAASVLFISASAQWANYREQAIAYQQERDAALVQKEAAENAAAANALIKEDAIAQKELQIDQLRDDLDQIRERLDQQTLELTRERDQRVLAEGDRTRLQETLNVLGAEVSGLRKQRDELLSEQFTRQTQLAALNQRVLELTANNTILGEQVRNLQQKLIAAQEAPAPSAAATTAAPVQPTVAGPIEGEIDEINGVYASVNIGEASGVQPGMVLMVHRGGRYLGELRIDRVLAESSQGKLDYVQDDIQPGDRVSFEQS